MTTEHLIPWIHCVGGLRLADHQHSSIRELDSPHGEANPGERPGGAFTAIRGRPTRPRLGRWRCSPLAAAAMKLSCPKFLNTRHGELEAAQGVR